ncbi:MAG: hypothetical protein A3F72_11290 [Bacteroidetes bacterium RIFCSPLOWO2_12_FULL_35_15]|nr:MAG: hypothetical protein A3F72_11290 [Bacteroidetes bacterium RIFCSPLOWO2_12_FULL_35_15]
MKTLRHILLGLILIISGISTAQVINININKDSTKTVNPPPAAPPPAAQPPAKVEEPEQKTETFYGVFGLRFMPTFSSLKLQNASGNTIKGEFVLSYGGGAILGLNFNNNVGLEIECIYNNLSQKYKDQDLERKIHINYLNVPLLLSLNTGRANTVNLNVVAGPQLGVNLGSSVTTSGSEGVDTVQAVLAVKKSDFGFAYGAGLDFGLNKSKTARLDIGFRGVFGLININDKSKSIETNQYYILEKAHIETYSAYIGFLILF